MEEEWGGVTGVGVTGWDSRGATLLLAALLLPTLSLSRFSKSACDREVPTVGDWLLLLLLVVLEGREGVKLSLLGVL